MQRFVFSSSCSLYGAAGDDFLDETAEFNPGDALRRVEGAGRARHRRTGERRVQPDVPAQRHGVRRLGPAARRPRGQQPRRLRGHHRRGADEERRHALAAARAHRRHRPGVRRHARRRHRPRAQPGVQRRLDGRELPRPRGGRDRRLDRARLRGHVRRRRRSRRPQLPRQLRAARGVVPRVQAAVDRARRRRGALRGLPAGIGPDDGRRSRTLAIQRIQHVRELARSAGRSTHRPPVRRGHGDARRWRKAAQ